MTEDEASVAHTEHRCVLGTLVRHVARTSDGDRPTLVAEALGAMLRDGRFDRCCVPRYLALAPTHALRECQLPIDEDRDVSAQVIVWPVGARDVEHPHTDGWTVFVPVRGELATVEHGPDEPLRVAPLASRRAVVLRPEEGIRHLVRNAGPVPALSVHVFGVK